MSTLQCTIRYIVDDVLSAVDVMQEVHQVLSLVMVSFVRECVRVFYHIVSYFLVYTHDCNHTHGQTHVDAKTNALNVKNTCSSHFQTSLHVQMRLDMWRRRNINHRGRQRQQNETVHVAHNVLSTQQLLIVRLMPCSSKHSIIHSMYACKKLG